MSELNTFISIEPGSEFLRSYIDYYYFHQNTGDKSEQYVFYPNHKNALTIYRNSDVSFKPGHSVTCPDADRKYCFIYTALYRHIHTVEMIPPYNRIGIVFQPLGINHFLPQNLSFYMNDYVNIDFNFFERSMGEDLEAVFDMNDVKERVAWLDAYFTKSYIGMTERRIKEAVSMILDSDRKMTVQSLSEHLNISRKTLLRLFREHMVCSVKDYMNTVQFRTALNRYQKSQNKPSLTSLAYETNYYDQSDFINHFKKMAGYNPGRLFKEIRQLGSRDTFWTFK